MNYGSSWGGATRWLHLRFTKDKGEEFIRRYGPGITMEKLKGAFLHVYIAGTQADINRALRISKLVTQGK